MERRAYLLIYSGASITREQVKNWANSDPAVITWRYDLPNSFYLISDKNAQELSDAFVKRIGEARFLITEVSDNRQGYLPKDTWYLFRNKKLPEK